MSVHADDESRVRMLLGDVASDSIKRGESGPEYAERLRRIAAQIHAEYLKTMWKEEG